MKKADELIGIVENALLKVNLATHLELCKMQGGMGFDTGTLRIRIADEVISSIKPQIEGFIENIFTRTSNTENSSCVCKQKTHL